MSLLSAFRSSRPGFGGRYQLIVIGIAALVGLVASSTWFRTAQRSWKGVMLERQVNLDKEISGKALINVWNDIQGLDEGFLPGRHLYLPSLAGQLLIQDRSIPTGEKSAALPEAARAARTALSREPADGMAWARLAWFEYLLGGPSPRVVSALRMSIYTAPNKQRLVNWRLYLAARSRPFWDEGFETLVHGQIQQSWRVRPGALSRAALESDLLPTVRKALADDHDALNRLEELVSRHRPPVQSK